MADYHSYHRYPLGDGSYRQRFNCRIHDRQSRDVDIDKSENIMGFDLSILEELGQMTVLDENRNSLEIGSLWQNQRAAMVFVRHFG